MRFKAILAATYLSAPVVPAIAGTLYGNADAFSLTEAWSNYTQSGSCAADGNVFGPWVADFGGVGGCTKLVTGPALELGGSANAALVHADVQQGNSDGKTGADLYLRVKMKTMSQYNGASARSWEVGWITWNGKFDTGCSCYTFNYLILHPAATADGATHQGWELGTVYNHLGSSTLHTIATDNANNYPILNLYDVEINQANSTQNGPGFTLMVKVNGAQIINYTDTNKYLFTSGWVAGLYEEGAIVDFSYVNATRSSGAVAGR